MLKKTIVYYREAIKGHPNFDGQREIFKFTDELLPTHQWTDKLLGQLNVTLRTVYNGPFDWEAVEEIMMTYVMVRDALLSPAGRSLMWHLDRRCCRHLGGPPKRDGDPSLAPARPRLGLLRPAAGGSVAEGSLNAQVLYEMATVQAADVF